MKTERSLQRVRAWFPDDPACPCLEALGEGLSRGQARRMSVLGRLLYGLLRGEAVDPAEPLVYGTAFAEARALETYLRSLPAASPTAFQTSIHPSALQQALIARGQPVGHLVPLAGEDDLAARACLCALLSPAPAGLLLLGEETGTWLLDHGLASRDTWAVLLRWGPGDTEEPVADLTVDFTAPAPAPVVSTRAFAQALHEHRAVELAAPGGGCIRFQPRS
ncbi:MAG: hypothetical protein JJT96_16055 [Opitutales bacterium]|nr:hypothetical protein [Opitutales bacterium]